MTNIHEPDFTIQVNRAASETAFVMLLLTQAFM